MTDLSRTLREALLPVAEVRTPEVLSEQVSADGTRKWVMRLHDGNCIETVFIPEPDRGTRDLARADGHILLTDVTFTYPGRGQPALRGIDLEIAPGETVALVGPSGSGKTTIANLLPRFHDPDGGTVRIDGIDVRELTLEALRANIALVSQEIVLFDDTVEANVAYGAKAGADREEVLEAIRAANALEFVEASGKEALITNPQNLERAMAGETGTRIVP